MKLFAKKFSIALASVALVSALATSEAQACKGAGCGLLFGAAAGLVAGAAIAAQPRPAPAPIYVAPAYARPGYVYYDRPAYESCRKIRWQDDYGRWHRSYECTRY